MEYQMNCQIWVVDKKKRKPHLNEKGHYSFMDAENNKMCYSVEYMNQGIYSIYAEPRKIPPEHLMHESLKPSKSLMSR